MILIIEIIPVQIIRLCAISNYSTRVRAGINSYCYMKANPKEEEEEEEEEGSTLVKAFTLDNR
jgi:hypothetical protein